MGNPALVGFATAFSLILAIGAQNAFVLRQGLLRVHVFPLCLFCAVSDAILIAVGVAGFGALADRLPWFPSAMAAGGATFLFVYGVLRFRAAWQCNYDMELSGQSPSLGATLATGAAFTWLNPHVYLDTLGLIGAVSTQYPDQSDKIVFTLGATLASFVFFFSLGYGARLLAPVMQSARAWRILDIGIGLLMWSLAAGLATSLL